MPEEDVLPKTGRSKDWLAYADQKIKEFKDHHAQRTITGELRNPGPLQDDHSKMLAKHADEARKMGMDLLRKETKEEERKASEKTAGSREQTRKTARPSSRR